jgi:transposase-like protein
MKSVKMRCARCSKPFKSSDAKQTLCPDCAAKERQARAKGAVGQPVATPARAVPAPKIVGPAATVLGAAPSAASAAPPDTGAFGSAARRAEQEDRHALDHHGRDRAHSGTPGQQHPNQRHPVPPLREPYAPQTTHGSAGRPGPVGDRLIAGTTKTPPPPRTSKPPKERTPPPPQELTAEQREQVERRYLELAQPTEFDGIRTQIAAELHLPRLLVRKSIFELRQRMGLPSWWELQGFPGTPTDLERIRAAYQPLLPVPPIGVHKQLAEQLGLEPHAVYKGIRQVRAQMGLPQFNAPEQHPEYVRAAVTSSDAQPESGAAAG